MSNPVSVGWRGGGGVSDEPAATMSARKGRGPESRAGMALSATAAPKPMGKKEGRRAAMTPAGQSPAGGVAGVLILQARPAAFSKVCESKVGAAPARPPGARWPHPCARRQARGEAMRAKRGDRIAISHRQPAGRAAGQASKANAPRGPEGGLRGSDREAGG